MPFLSLSLSSLVSTKFAALHCPSPPFSSVLQLPPSLLNHKPPPPRPNNSSAASSIPPSVHPCHRMGSSNRLGLPPALNFHFFRLYPPLSPQSPPPPHSQPQPQRQSPPSNFISNLRASLQSLLTFNYSAQSPPPSIPPVSDPTLPTCCTVPLFRPYVAKVPWHGGPRAFLSRLFPRYGHYCGPNWSSGKEAGSMLWDRRPIDWLDHCCYCHDIGYDTHDQAKLLKADLAFLECLERPRMATKGGATMSIIYRAMCIAGLRSFLIPYRTHLVRLQSGPSLYDYFGNMFAKIPSMNKVGADNQKVRF